MRLHFFAIRRLDAQRISRKCGGDGVGNGGGDGKG
jgi:hypothetical protein